MSERKQPIPFLPMVIGVVTSPTGAVIRDILHRLTDRFPCRVIVWPVLVQGEDAASQIASAIEGFNSLPEGASIPHPDVLIVARGGGSIEDLWAFNEENVIRAAAGSDIPLISAVGHETDTTLLDFVADMRAPTPTAAAEMAVPVRLDLIAQIMDARTRLTNTMNNLVERQRSNIASLARGLPRPTQLVEEMRQRLDDWSERLANGALVEVARQRAAVDRFGSRLTDPRQRISHELGRTHSEARALKLTIGSVVREKQDRLNHATALLRNLSYLRTLERGFVCVQDQYGKTVASVKTTKPAMKLSLQFYDGKINTIVAGQKSTRKHVTDDDGKSGRQGSLWDFQMATDESKQATPLPIPSGDNNRSVSTSIDWPKQYARSSRYPQH